MRLSGRYFGEFQSQRCRRHMPQVIRRQAASLARWFFPGATLVVIRRRSSVSRDRVVYCYRLKRTYARLAR
jgi:DNA-binding transcriptional regulator YbjK